MLGASILIDFSELFPVHKVWHVHKILAGLVLRAFSFHCALQKTDGGTNLTDASILFAKSMYPNDSKT